ncbi:hypothetical protein XF_0288 [Xylella fastidiosa 9a5c]|uniref:Uncharacterized protein n=1 Tax=Xylella fastidiosa (strain 9a5c) TaxID=160492 RepID=Q9PGL0_XYLFA|nr:hypothetical protein XF_0288 [Xylella fastidiosa 9a5c]
MLPFNSKIAISSANRLIAPITIGMTHPIPFTFTNTKSILLLRLSLRIHDECEQTH